METIKQAAIPIANYKQTISFDSERIVVEDASGRHELFLCDIEMVHVYPLFFPVLRIVPVLVSDVYLTGKGNEVKAFNVSRSDTERIVSAVSVARPDVAIVREPLRRGIGGFSGYLMRSLDRQAELGVPHASLPLVFIFLDLFWMILLFGLLGYGITRMLF
ncbi:MAG: hypothetical protein KBD19_00940 [Candidatus Moranbacteria bacterium]|nr:hypothetical protein [Candidatus Moranbacteria bacterium]